LSDALKGLPTPSDPDLLVGYETSDDAAVYRLTPELAMINTIDFITPPVDDPYWFGQIAAANAISDIYAMGGRPVTALNVVMFPGKILDLGLLKEILRGGYDKVTEAGALLVGGHTVDDEEPKYGLCVNGTVHPERLLKNVGARPGDALILTKPLGSGVLFNAVRSGRFLYKTLERDTLPVIATLNRAALETAQNFTINACTDITGFGIGGHALEMAGHDAALTIRYDALPFFAGALEMYKKGETTGSNQANRALCQERLTIKAALDRSREELLFDPQTSGGLLLAIPGTEATLTLSALKEAGVTHAAIIGEVKSGRGTLQVV
jgi:selenide,water dikinase